MKRSAILLGLATMFAAGCAGTDSVSLLSPYGESAVRLRQYESKQIAFRYIDDQGYPRVGGVVRLEIQGAANGASLETVVARADAQGVARTVVRAGLEASFTVSAYGEDTMPAQVQVSVARQNGGVLEARVYNRAASPLSQGQVMLVNSVSCASFDPRLPPAVVSETAQPSQTVTLSTAGVPVRFTGLVPGKQYGVVVVATGNGGAAVAKGCAEGVTISQQEADQAIVRQVSVYVEDIDPGQVNITGNALLVETRFDYPLYLGRVANLLKDVSNSPLGFIIDRSLDTGDTWVAILGSVVKDQLISYVEARSPSALNAKGKLQQVVQFLSGAGDIKLYTQLAINDEDDSSGQLTAKHTFRYFTANVGGTTQKYFLKPGVSLHGETVPQMTLDAEVQLTLEGASRVRIGSHTLSLPIAEAIIGTLMVDTFNAYNLKSVLSSLVDCSGVGQLVGDFYRSHIADSSWQASLISAGMAGACQTVLADLADDASKEILEDIDLSGLGTDISFEGSANIGTAADGHTIIQLTDGKWVGVGSFTASRM